MVPEAVEYVDTVDIFVESIAFGLEHLDRLGTLATANHLTLRAHVEQFSTMRSVPVALEHNARSLDHLSADPSRRHRAARELHHRRRAAPRRRVHGSRGHRAGARADRGRRDRGAGHRRQPWHLADLLAAADRRAGRPPLRAQHPRGAAGSHVERRLRPQPPRRPSVRSSRASAPTSSCSTPRPSTSPTAWAATRSRPRSWRASRCTCAPTPSGGSRAGEPDWQPRQLPHRRRRHPRAARARSTRRAGPAARARAGLLAAGARRLDRHPPRPCRGRDARRGHVHRRRSTLLDRSGRRPQHAEPGRRGPLPPPRAVRGPVPPHRRPRALRPGR